MRFGLLSAVLLVIISNQSAAQGLIYHFSGSVSQIEFDDAGLVAASGLTIGSPVQYTFYVDFQSPGTVTHYDGSVEELQDLLSGNNYAHFFYADFLGGNILRDDAAEQLRPNNGVLASDYGMSFGNPPNGGAITSGGVYYSVGISKIHITNYILPQPTLSWGQTYGDPFVEQWQIGEQVLAVCVDSNVEQQGSLFRAEVTLDQITPVPEPTTCFLIVAGVLAWLGFYRMRDASINLAMTCDSGVCDLSMTKPDLSS